MAAKAPPFSLTKTWHKDTYAAIDPRVRSELKLSGKTVVISGGGSGIGKGMTRAFAEAEASKIAVLGRRESVLQETKTEIESAVGGRTTIQPHTVDIQDLPTLKRIANEIGPWDILIANAGYLSEPTPLIASDPAEWWKLFEVNVKGVFNLARSFLPNRRQDATLIGVAAGSIQIDAMARNFSAHNSSKFAGVKMLEILAKEVQDIHVVSMHPGDDLSLTTQLGKRRAQGQLWVTPGILAFEIELIWWKQSKLEYDKSDAKLAYETHNSKQPGEWVEIFRPKKFEAWKKQNKEYWDEYYTVVNKRAKERMREREEHERIADMERQEEERKAQIAQMEEHAKKRRAEIEKQEQERRARIARQEREKEAEIERAKREREAELARQEQKRKAQIMKQENERLAEIERQEQKRRTETERQEREKRAAIEKHRLAELQKTEHHRFVQLMETFEQEREADLRRQKELALPYTYDDLSLSSSRFRLLRLQFRRESPFLGRAPDTFSAPRPNATEPIRQQYDLQLFDAREKHRQHQVEWYRRYEGALECSMQTFDLEDPDCPHFEALSYEWKANSDMGNKRLIILDESRFLGSMEIGYNLWGFLEHIQQPDDEFWVWADAVCINQSSLQERGHQVKLMGQIYTRASKVLAWLPVEDPDFCVAKWKKLMAGGTLSDWEMGAATRMFHSHYWTRKWIIQEILLARTVVLVLGQHELPMQDLESKFSELERTRTSQPSTSSLVSGSLPFAELAAYRRSRREGKVYPEKLYELLPTYQTNMCSDPFDHVYALYNLIGEHRQHLEVKYGEAPHLWISKVLQFLDRYEQPSRNTIMYLAVTLSHQNGSYDLHSADRSFQERPIHLTATAFDQGAVLPREECATSMYLREQVSSLHPGAKMTFKMVSGCWQIHHRAPSTAIAKVSKRVFYYFDIPEQSLCGMATARIEAGDHVLTFINTNFGFVVRFEKSSTEDAEQHLRILGRCYLFEKSSTGSSAEKDEDWKPMESFGSDKSRSNGNKAQPNSNKLHSNGKKLEKKLPSHDFKLSISDLFTLAYAATDIEFPRTSQRADATRTTERRTDVGFQKPPQQEDATRAIEEKKGFEEKPKPSKRGGIFEKVSSVWGSV
ncbi:hypothetical protein PRZ48_005550 [Zasmidium cellare]|uniref:Heterokaryon incompatibility domain-containing protein n=1 Tax=Zasmidium cellare TaxID=395010 RepID=A0ABR0EKP0_ZASCE|nr:hypothetical protein PRZ48_005550 [Zasmidium cellare]